MSVSVNGIEVAAKAELAALEARVSAIESDAEADYQKLKAFAAKAYAYFKTGAGAGSIATAGYLIAKFDVVSLIAKLL